jgi:hypothetical protein
MITKKNKQRKLGPLSLAVLSLMLGLILTASVALFNPSPSASAEDRVTICHRTGSETNPYVVITIDERALPAHLEHGDIYPVPPGGCPTSTASTPTGTPTEPPTYTPTGTSTSTPTNTPTDTPTQTPTNTPQPTPTPQGEPDPGEDY